MKWYKRGVFVIPSRCLRLNMIQHLILTFLFILTGSSFISSSSAHPASYAIWAVNSAITRGQGNGLDANGNPLVSYEHGELQWALRLLYERTGNETYYNYIKTGVDNVVSSNGSVGGGYRHVFSLNNLIGYLKSFPSVQLNFSWIPCGLAPLSCICTYLSCYPGFFHRETESSLYFSGTIRRKSRNTEQQRISSTTSCFTSTPVQHKDSSGTRRFIRTKGGWMAFTWVTFSMQPTSRRSNQITKLLGVCSTNY